MAGDVQSCSAARLGPCASVSFPKLCAGFGADLRRALLWAGAPSGTGGMRQRAGLMWRHSAVRCVSCTRRNKRFFESPGLHEVFDRRAVHFQAFPWVPVCPVEADEYLINT